MAEVKHTPGPWGFGNTVSYERLILGKGGNGGYVCHVTVEQCGGGIIAQSMEAEREANARLIAAAPDLFEAGTELQAARKAQNADPSAENASRVRAASDAFDTALSKATAQQEGR